jgi:hypothetical protein
MQTRHWTGGSVGLANANGRTIQRWGSSTLRRKDIFHRPHSSALLREVGKQLTPDTVVIHKLNKQLRHPGASVGAPVLAPALPYSVLGFENVQKLA